MVINRNLKSALDILNQHLELEIKLRSLELNQDPYINAIRSSKINMLSTVISLLSDINLGD